MKLSVYNIKRKVFLSLAVFMAVMFSVSNISATHIAGGNIYYECLGGDMYEVTLEVRRDCINGAANAPFDNPASVGIFNGLGQLTTLGISGQLLMEFNNQDTIVEALTSECRVLGSEVCIERTIYKATIELPFEPQGYILAYQRCCRSIDLINVVDPTDTGTTEWISISRKAQETCNSSPKFNNWPTIYACSEIQLTFDHSATDIDGDSLVYKLCTPYAGASDANPIPQPPNRPPYDLIQWNAGYSTDNPLGAAVPLTINPQTGLLTGTPQLTGQYLVGVCVEEYRDGLLVTTVRRNFEYNIRVCINNPVADFIVDNPNCEGLTQTFENVSTPGDYTWNFDYPNNTITSNEVNPTYTFPAPGLYPVQLIVVDQDCIDTTVINVGVSIPGDPTAAFSVSSVDCSDDVVLNFVNETVTVQEQIGFNWQFTADGVTTTSTDENPTVTFPNGTILSVTYEVTTISGCTDVITDEVVVQSSVLTLIGDEIEVCEMNQIQLVLEASDNLTFTWSPTTNLDLTDPSNPIATTQSDITYSVTATNGVCTIVDQISLIVSEEQNVVVLGPTNICGTDATLEAISFNGAQFEWFADENFTVSLGMDNPITLSPALGATTYYVALTGDVCQGSAAFTVNNEPLNFNISPDVEFANCAGDTIMVTVNNLASNHTLTYEWGPQYVVAGANEATASLVFDVAGTFNIPLSVVNQFGCVVDTLINVDVVERPFFDNTPLFVCIGDEIGLNESGNPGWFYVWSTADMSLLPDPTAANPIITGLTETTVFNVMIADNEARLCPSEYTLLVTVPDAINIQAPDVVRYCNDIDTTIQVVTDVVTNIQLLDAMGVSVFTGSMITVSDFPDGTYTIVATDINLCQESQTLIIDAYDAINMLTPADVVYCPGDTPVIEVMTDVAVTVELIDVMGMVVFTGNTIPVTEFPDGVYTITATDVNGCTESNMVTFTTYDAINLDAPTEILYCPGEEVSILINGDIDIVIKITNADGDIVATGGEVLVSDLPPGTYTIMATSNDGCVEMQTLEVLSPANINLSVMTATPKYCVGDPVILTATTDTDVMFEWFNSDNENIGTTASITVNPEGMQTYTVMATDPSGCGDVAEITVMPYILDVTIEAPTLLCEDEEGVITITNNDDSQQLMYQWSPTDQIVSGANTDQITILLTQNTTFEVLITNMDGCQWTETATVILSAFEPDVILTADPMNILLGQTTQLEVNQDPDYDYEWTNGETLDQDDIYNPIATPEDEITTYAVTVTNENGCTDVASLDINVTLPNCDVSDVFVPNLFSPNGDNFNDNWVIESNFIDNITISVYDRWGEEVFQTKDQYPGWDGTYEGELLEPDVYGYWLDIECINGFKYTTQGNVTLMR